MAEESEQLKAVKARYKSSLMEKASMLNEHISVLQNEQCEATNYADVIHAELHKLAGSSGMYGYADISQASRSIMASIEHQDLGDLSASLTKLRNLLEHHA